MNIQLAIQKLLNATPLAGRVSAERDDCVAWVGVYPLDMNRESAQIVVRKLGGLVRDGDLVFRIRVFEVLRERSNDDTWLSEADLFPRADFLVIGADALRVSLSEFDFLDDGLEPHFNSEYPI